MAYQSDFRRYEIKYFLDPEQMEAVMDAFGGRMEKDRYAVSDIRNVYLDTDAYTLARRSISHPAYKEKLRVRKYSSDPSDPVFVEIKKKCDSVTYKRRVSMDEGDAMRWMGNCQSDMPDSQIGREIEAFCDRYPTIGPKIGMRYHRESFRSAEGCDLRATFDRNVTATLKDFDLDGEMEGADLIPEGCSILELKTGTSVPLWLSRTLSSVHAYPRSFSKYGAAYKMLVCGKA